MINLLIASIPLFFSCPALVGFVGFWFVLGCFRLVWWLVGGVSNE